MGDQHWIHKMSCSHDTCHYKRAVFHHSWSHKRDAPIKNVPRRGAVSHKNRTYDMVDLSSKITLEDR